MQKLFERVDLNLLTVKKMADKITNGEHFAFSRYGDGEFDAMVGTIGVDCLAANCDGHEYFPEMGRQLGAVLINWKNLGKPNYYIGIHWSDRIGQKTLNWLNKNSFPAGLKFANNSEFHNTLVTGEIEIFYKALEGKRVILVAPKRLKQQTKIEIEGFIEVAETNSWLDREKVKEGLLKAGLTDTIVLFCVGLPAALFIDDIAQKGFNCTLLDFGSTLDPNIGVHSRSFHRKHNLK